MPVTRPHIEKLKASRPVPNQSMDYTIGGNTETSVHTTVESERIYAINQGEKRLLKASERVQTDHVFAANTGRAKAQFGKAAANPDEYIRMQKEAAIGPKRNEPDRER